MHPILRTLILISLCLSNVLNAKIRLLTFHYNRPDFIELQCRTFKKFLRDDYELIVFNDARTPELENAISDMCEKHGVLCVRYEPEWHRSDPLNQQILQQLNDSTIYSHLGFHLNDVFWISEQPSIRHCHVIQYALDNFGYDHDDIVCIVDGDIFPIRPLSIRSLLYKKHIIGIQRSISTENIDYLWVPFIAFDSRTIPHKEDLKFHADVIGDKLHDTGAHTYHYLKNHPDIIFKKFAGYASTIFYNVSNKDVAQYGFNLREIELIKTLPWPLCVEFHLDHKLLHFGASSFDLEGHEIKSRYLIDFLEKILEPHKK